MSREVTIDEVRKFLAEETRRVRLFLTHEEVGLLELLPGTMPEKVTTAILFRLRNPRTLSGAFRGPFRDDFLVEIPKRVLSALVDRYREPVELAIRCWLGGIPQEYIDRRRALVEGGQS